MMVRSLLVSSLRTHTRRCSSSTSTSTSSTTAKHADPLRILFCGSDDFSIESLRALDHARQNSPGLIDHIHVAHRPAKQTGRGLKVSREVPLAAAASSLSLPTHVFDTFTGFTPPFAYNLVVAVSFGLLVPPRILNLARYGGLNVHPSLLPDLRGSAPIEHAILRQRAHTGVSVQTLHPTRFDDGVVLAQTPSPGVRIGTDETATELRARLARAGAQMLLDVLRERRFAPPLEPAGWHRAPVDHAPKITKQDRLVDFATMDMSRILALHRALGHVSCRLPNGETLLVHALADTGTVGEGEPGLAVDPSRDTLLFRAACGRVGRVDSSTYPGGRRGMAYAKVMNILNDSRP